MSDEEWKIVCAQNYPIDLSLTDSSSLENWQIS
jgi:hypothetical protein